MYICIGYINDFLIRPKLSKYFLLKTQKCQF